jgi:hypothetical protein
VWALLLQALTNSFAPFSRRFMGAWAGYLSYTLFYMMLGTAPVLLLVGGTWFGGVLVREWCGIFGSTGNAQWGVSLGGG